MGTRTCPWCLQGLLQILSSCRNPQLQEKHFELQKYAETESWSLSLNQFCKNWVTEYHYTHLLMADIMRMKINMINSVVFTIKPLLSANNVIFPMSLCSNARISCSTSALPRPWPWNSTKLVGNKIYDIVTFSRKARLSGALWTSG